MTQERGEDSPTPVVHAASAVPAKEVVSQVVRVNQSEALENVSPADHLFASVSEERVNGETFAEKMARVGVDPNSPGGHEAYLEFQRELAAQEADKMEESEPRDDDGAIYFENGAETLPLRALKLPADIPVPSRDVVRRHKAAGHCP